MLLGSSSSSSDVSGVVRLIQLLTAHVEHRNEAFFTSDKMHPANTQTGPATTERHTEAAHVSLVPI